MTRKDYAALARIVRENTNQDSFYGDSIDPDNLIDDLVDMCQEDNPRFDPSKFRAACEL